MLIAAAAHRPDHQISNALDMMGSPLTERVGNALDRIMSTQQAHGVPIIAATLRSIRQRAAV
jgi:hypothetical protein